jgi:adhesin HecA-like repeat protein
MSRNTLNPSCLSFQPIVIAPAGSVTLDVSIYSYISIQTDSACTATVTRVDNEAGTVVANGAASTFTVGTSTFKNQAVDWQFYTISAATGYCRVCFG